MGGARGKDGARVRDWCEGACSRPAMGCHSAQHVRHGPRGGMHLWYWPTCQGQSECLRLQGLGCNKRGLDCVG